MTAPVWLNPLEALEETVELLSDPAALRQIEEARAEVAPGETVSGDQLRTKYLGR